MIRIAVTVLIVVTGIVIWLLLRPVEVVPIQALPELSGKSIEVVIQQLGPVSSETQFTVANAPTKAWHFRLHQEYPKDNPELAAIVIRELSWKQGAYTTTVCAHQEDERWLVLEAIRVHNNVRF